MHRFSEKAKKEIQDKHAKLAKTAKEARDPQAEYQSSLYPIPGKKNTYGVPVMALKNCAVSACRFIDGVNMTTARGAFHVIDPGCGLIEITDKKGPQFDERMVRIGGFKKIATPRYRGRFDQWFITFEVVYNKNVISPSQLVNLYDNAGFSVGLHEHRPEKNGNLGMFEVVSS